MANVKPEKPEGTITEEVVAEAPESTTSPAKEPEAVKVSSNGQVLVEVTLVKTHHHDAVKHNPGDKIMVTAEQKKRLQTWGTAL